LTADAPKPTPKVTTEPEYVKERKRLGTHGKLVITNPGASHADLRRRTELIRATAQAWYNLNPRYAINMMNYLKNVTESEHSGGDYKNGEGYVSLRLPIDLYGSLRKVFAKHAPDMEAFGTDDVDIKILCKEFPKLMPGGFRSRSRKD